MTNQEALDVLTVMAQRAMGNAADHQAVADAHAQLKAVVSPPEPSGDLG